MVLEFEKPGVVCQISNTLEPAEVKPVGKRVSFFSVSEKRAVCVGLVVPRLILESQYAPFINAPTQLRILNRINDGISLKFSKLLNAQQNDVSPKKSQYFRTFWIA